LPPLAADVELAIYRVAQECLTNAARHAGATRTEIQLEAAAEGVTLRVSDDGIGMRNGSDANGGSGLRGMRERALYAHGTLAIGRSPSGGVEVRLVVPAAPG
jgi:two-component system sensor histidine kinase UhpB